LSMHGFVDGVDEEADVIADVPMDVITVPEQR